MSTANSTKPFQRLVRYPVASLETLGRHVELLEDNIAKKFRGQDSVTATVAPAPIPDDRIFGSLDFSIGASTVADLKLYTVPLFSPQPANGVFVLSRAICWLTTRLGTTDTGNVNVRIGTSLGDNTIMTDQNVVAATTTGVIGGLSIASRGSALLVANGYEVQLAGNTTVWVRASTTGTITQGTVLVELFGYFFPTAANG
jgi:hypothetical protein